MAGGAAGGSFTRQLFVEFLPWVQGYNAGAFLLGLGCGYYDGTPAPPAPSPQGGSSASSSAPAVPERRLSPAEAAAQALASPPRELGFARQFVVTLPGVALALRLGRRARELGAPPRSLALVAAPSLAAPLLLYLLSGYPSGVALRAAWDARSHGAGSE
eukprot:TRINITY_DN64072_c0_g1_i1.p1 TRINITY_DN64072_c0_g1~~TRINITY_DN64072_c0_g1_i1.p1  ORF type:complete len:159 (-),score=48.44 TRINITY_DN64072_c0_g1_i1:125-601(-)